MKRTNVTNKETAALAKSMVAFRTRTGTIYGDWQGEFTYAVFSYGPHFPLYIWSRGQWYENKDKYSCTTSKHLGQARPTSNTILRGNDWMVSLARLGIISMTANRLKGAI